VLLKTPPLLFREPANTVVGVCGSTTSDSAKSGAPAPVGAQLSAPFVVLKIGPPRLPTYKIEGVAGLMAMLSGKLFVIPVFFRVPTASTVRAFVNADVRAESCCRLRAHTTWKASTGSTTIDADLENRQTVIGGRPVLTASWCF
jgi:hypothetical protein